MTVPQFACFDDMWHRCGPMRHALAAQSHAGATLPTGADMAEQLAQHVRSAGIPSLEKHWASEFFNDVPSGHLPSSEPGTSFAQEAAWAREFAARPRAPEMEFAYHQAQCGQPLPDPMVGSHVGPMGLGVMTTPWFRERQQVASGRGRCRGGTASAQGSRSKSRRRSKSVRARSLRRSAALRSILKASRPVSGETCAKTQVGGGASVPKDAASGKPQLCSEKERVDVSGSRRSGKKVHWGPWQDSKGSSTLSFQPQNPYLDSSAPLEEAIRLLSEGGHEREALTALEAEVQQHPESSEGWRLLGQLYADLDQDLEAIQCLRRGYEVDPYNLDGLLALGVSLLNEHDPMEAMQCLRAWLEHHDEFEALVMTRSTPPNCDDEAWKKYLKELFVEASRTKPQDPDVWVGLGVLRTINKEHGAAVQDFATACRLRPQDHMLWSKLGASIQAKRTLRPSDKSEHIDLDQALVAYDRSLHLRPSCVRSWCNLAAAHLVLGRPVDAVRLFLSALSLNPHAKHIWESLDATLGRSEFGGEVTASARPRELPLEFGEAIGRRDFDMCRKLMDGILDPAILPKPELKLLVTAEELLASMGL